MSKGGDCVTLPSKVVLNFVLYKLCCILQPSGGRIIPVKTRQFLCLEFGFLGRRGGWATIDRCCMLLAGNSEYMRSLPRIAYAVPVFGHVYLSKTSHVTKAQLLSSTINPSNIFSAFLEKVNVKVICFGVTTTYPATLVDGTNPKKKIIVATWY